MDWLQVLVFPAIRALILIFVLLTGFAYLTWYERKLLAASRCATDQIGPANSVSCSRPPTP